MNMLRATILGAVGVLYAGQQGTMQQLLTDRVRLV